MLSVKAFFMPEKIHLSGPTILFDGVCNLCNGFINFIIKTDKSSTLKFLPLQSQRAKSLLDEFPGNDLHIYDLTTVILIDNKKIYRQSDAVLRIASHLPYPWKVLKYFRVVPKRLRDLMYGFVARNRYKWFGQKPHCMVPSPDVLDRFIL